MAGSISPGSARQKKYEEALRRKGFRRVCFWVHADDIETVKALVENWKKGGQADE